MGIVEQAAALGIKAPAPTTLRRYNLTAVEWLRLLKNQGWRCPVCPPDKSMDGIRWNTDHDHVARWKHMEPAERKRHVRGILCAYCNYRRVNSRMSAAEALRIAKYLAEFEARRDR